MVAEALGPLIAVTQDPTPGDLERFREATTEVGLFAVTGHHDLSSGDVNKDSDEGIPALQNFARCIGTHGISLASSGNAMKASLRDGTHKTTVATGTNGTQPHELPAAVQASCPEFAQTSQVRLYSKPFLGEGGGGELDDGPTPVLKMWF